MPAKRIARDKRPAPRRMTPAQAWALATRIYHDLDEPQGERERAWLLRASRAYAAGNWVHLVRIVDVCDLLQIAPPELLAPALAPIVRAAATGEKLGHESGGRHANLARKVAEAVLAVESLMQIEAQRARLARAGRLPRGNDARDAAATYFRASAGPTSRGYHLTRSRDELEGHAKRARKLLRDPAMLEFLGANFPPRLLAQLASAGKKPA